MWKSTGFSGGNVGFGAVSQANWTVSSKVKHSLTLRGLLRLDSIR
jgi:hypothetical protein